MMKEPDSRENMAGDLENQKTNQVSVSEDLLRKERRSVPHWSLVTAALVLFALLLFVIRDHLSPITISIAILILLYPSRRTRELKPLLFLVFVIAAVSIWWRLSALFTPFIVAFFIAYAIDPVVDWLTLRRLPRLLVVLLIIGFIVSVMVGVGIIVVPRLVLEVGELASNVPRWMDDAWSWGTRSFVPWLQGLDLPLRDAFSGLQERLPGLLQNFLGKFADWSTVALGKAMRLLSGLANLILIPILTVYFLNEFSRNKQRVYGIIPQRSKPLALEIYKSLNKVLSAYVRGQLLVCLFLATWIGTGLWLVADLPYALLLGITAGVSNLLPYVGTAATLILTLVVSLTQPEPLLTALKALIVFVTAQTLEGNLITPRVVGTKVGLHPLVVIFVVLLFATLFGFIGLLVAIPVTASAKEIFIVWKNRVKIGEV